MNPRINRYINFILDSKPSPFCEYIIHKELLNSDAQTVRDTYEWAIKFKLYNEMLEEQFPDGSWGDFYPMDTSAAIRKKHKITDRATIRRLHDLALSVDDEMVAKTVNLCRNIITGNFTNDNRRGDRTNPTHAYHVLYSFCPDDPFAAHVKEERTLSDEKQRAYMIYEWDHGPFDVVKLSDLILPDHEHFAFWMCGLEDAKHYKYFGEFMEEKTVPFLFSLCERLINPHDDVPVMTNRFYSKVGQYSEAWNNNDTKKKDLLLRIIRILNKCREEKYETH